MKKRLFIFNIVLLVSSLSSVSMAQSDIFDNDSIRYNGTVEERLTYYQRRVEGYEKVWNSLIPRFFTMQFAGSIGVVSAGPGWSYGKDKWETEMLLGFLPKFNDDDNKLTFTLRQTYIPWSFNITKRNWDLEPLTVSLMMNTIFDNRFWGVEPSKYPDGYYNFSSKVRFHLSLGQSLTFNLKSKYAIHKEITAYYEIGSCDLYLVSWATNMQTVKLKDMLSLSLGLKLRVF